jgi:diguanylate cyclase (GGDEF)-like protein
MLANIVLITLTVVLGVLLFLRERQLRRYRPVKRLEVVLASLRENIITSRTDGNIQKVAAQITRILIENLRVERIIFFRRQRQQFLINYIYGMKNLKRSRYRFSLNRELERNLTWGAVVVEPDAITEIFPADVSQLLEDEKITLIFPIHWMNNIYGIYFISSPLAFDHPLLQTFLYFLNQNISATYHVKRLESSRQSMEQRFTRQQQRLRSLERLEKQEATGGNGFTADAYFGLTEIHDRAKLFEAVADMLAKTLDTDHLALVAASDFGENGIAVAKRGTGDTLQTPDVNTLRNLNSRNATQRPLALDSTAEETLPGKSRESLIEDGLTHCYPFPLSEDEPGVLFWSQKAKPGPELTAVLRQAGRAAQHAFHNAREFNRVEEMSYTDSLTDLHNYRYFRKRLDEEIERAKRYGRSVGLLLFDIDGFKAFNDTHGHQQGDKLLREMGAVLKGSLRANDIIARYAGDEFCIIMPEADKTTSNNFMDRLRTAIADAEFEAADRAENCHVTISVGGAIYPDDAETSEKLIYCADMALLRSKSAGRDRGTLYSEELVR